MNVSMMWTVALAVRTLPQTTEAPLMLVSSSLWAIPARRPGPSSLIPIGRGPPDRPTHPQQRGISVVGGARFVYSPSLGQGVFSGPDLDVPDGDRVYELWLMDEEDAAPAGAFRPESPEEATVLVEGIEAGLTLAMTEEPEADWPNPPARSCSAPRCEPTEGG